MKIAIFTDTYTPQINGVVTSILTFKKELENLGHQVIVGGPKFKEGPLATPDEWRFNSMAFPFQKEHRVISPLSRQLRNFEENNFDIIHVQTPFSLGHLGQYLGWRYKIPVVHTYHTYWEEYLHYFPLLPKPICKMVYNKLLTTKFCNRCAHIIVPSNQMQEKLLEYGIKTPTTVIPTGIDIHHQVTPEKKEALMSKLGLPKNKRFLVFVGRLGQEKNIGFLVKMFQKVAQELPDVDLLIAGDGPEKENLIALSQSLGIEDRCHWLGYVTHDEVFTLYTLSTLIVFASKTETQGLSLLEGLAMGRPAVCVKAMGIEDILHNNQGGILCEEDTQIFADHCLSLLKDPKFYMQKAEEALHRAHSFSSTQTTHQLVQVYQDVIAHFA